MAKLYDITDWNEQSWWNTGGTRDKKIYLNPEDGELYYFKQSFKKGQRNYKHEFWSEIIAYEVGELLGFDILPYHIAIRGKVVGCISKSMINQESEELIEGGKYLQAFDTNFKPENIKERDRYTFQLIYSALFSFKKEKHLDKLIDTIVFDALTGNSDRHQENWAIINKYIVFSKNEILLASFIEKVVNFVLKQISNLGLRKVNDINKIEITKLLLPKITRYAPIYDSGCSFGRELNDEKVTQMLSNETEIQKYIEKGLAEIHWESKKITHFELVSKLIETENLKDITLSSIRKVIEKFDNKKVEQIIMNVDKELEIWGSPNVLPKQRKELALKLLTLRSDKLRTIYSQYK